MQGEEVRECLACGKQFQFIGVPVCRECVKEMKAQKKCRTNFIKAKRAKWAAK